MSLMNNNAISYSDMFNETNANLDDGVFENATITNLSVNNMSAVSGSTIISSSDIQAPLFIGLASSFSGVLSGNVSGPQNNTVINNGVVTNAMLATPITSNATANTIMERDSTGSSKVTSFNVSGVLTGNDYTGSYLDLTLNNTNQNAISILSGSSSKDVYLAAGRTTDEIIFWSDWNKWCSLDWC